MLTSLQLLHRLTRKLKVRDLAGLAARDRQELLDAANAGLRDFVTRLAPHRTETPRAEAVAAPQVIIVTAANASKSVSFTATDEEKQAMLGRTLMLPGDPQVNRLMTADTLLMPFLGSSGSVSATLYGDAVPFGTDDRRILNAPVWQGADGSSIRLKPIGSLQRQWPFYPFRQVDTLQTGTPEFFWTEPHNPEATLETPLWHLRLWPLPPGPGSLHWRMDSFPAALTMEDFVTGRNLTVDEREVMDLLAFAEFYLIGSALLAEGADGQVMLAARENAIRSMESAVQSRDTIRRRMTTPRKW